MERDEIFDFLDNEILERAKLSYFNIVEEGDTMKINYGWKITLIAWVLTPVIPTIALMMMYGEGMPTGFELIGELSLSFYALAAYMTVIWLPVGFWASRTAKTKGDKKAFKIVRTTFILLNVLLVMFYAMMSL